MKTKLLLLIAFMLCMDTVANTYPISPRPLRKLVKESQYIVYAHVVRIEEAETDDGWNNTKAILAIREVLQGRIKKDTIEVYFMPGLICPAPANYVKGTTVLAFLDSEKKSKGYTTHALSYGVKVLNEDGFSIYKDRIQEMQIILKMKDKVQQSIKTLDWLVECASNKHTRWEGVYELSPQSDFMSYYDREQDKFVTNLFLDRGHMKKLKDAFLKIESIDYSDLGLLDLVAMDYEEEVNRFLIQQLKKKDLDGIWYCEFIMARIAHYSNRDDLDEIIKKMQSVDYLSTDREEKIKNITKEFIDKL